MEVDALGVTFLEEVGYKIGRRDSRLFMWTGPYA